MYKRHELVPIDLYEYDDDVLLLGDIEQWMITYYEPGHAERDWQAWRQEIDMSNNLQLQERYGHWA